ncbi:MAG: DASS family sodium-coupled anion symporter [Rhodospirillales bacterium]|nr:DASS family sodium-coupled anion symporter [Rhodospirillales bacterium]MDH3912946.1 DASS family sodium-coupled anion symporter [Rhodospirillales bacterium]MDH3969603.1 DASS family sodium-coupled anion symporter [Rhodospirillales bacterium]
MTGSKERRPRLPRHRLIGLVAGPLVAAAVLASPAPEGLSPQGWWTAGVGLLMAVWWMTEALPLAVTALVPLVLFPLLGLRGIEAVTPAYAHPLVFLFLGGFLLARAMHVWELDRRLALAVLRLAGTSPRRVIGGLMAVTAFLSLWVSNTATAMVMLPIGQSLIAAFARQDEGRGEGTKGESVAPPLLLGIAYAATIGGMGTLVGTPPNALFAAFMAESYGVEISFVRWLLIGLPLVLVLLPLTWFVLTRVVFRVPDRGTLETAGLAAPGPMSLGARLTAGVMLLVAVCWIFRPPLAAALPWLRLSDAGIAVTGALLLFLLPADIKAGRFLLTWREAAEIRWDVLILFGGGLALAAAIGQSDLADWIGARLAGLGALPLILLLLAVGALIVLLGELASNTAMAAVFLPVAGATALAMGEPAFVLALPVALFATLGFMLPVATPPNAVIFGSGAIEMRHMLKAGWLLDLLGIFVVALGVLTLGGWVLGPG